MDIDDKGNLPTMLLVALVVILVILLYQIAANGAM